MLYGIIMVAAGVAMVVLALPRNGEARPFLNNAFISVIYIGAILTLTIFGAAFVLTSVL